MASKNVKKGIVVTYGDFTPKAKDFAKANSIVLINGPKLTQIISTVQESGNMQPQQDAERVCPQCGSEMVLRVAKKRAHQRKKFWGCSGNPDCELLLF